MESIHDVIDFGISMVVKDRNDIEANIKANFVLVIIGTSCGINMGTFMSVDSHFGCAKFVFLSSFHLHKNNVFSINGDDVNLLTIGSPVTFQYLITFIHEVLHR